MIGWAVTNCLLRTGRAGTVGACLYLMLKFKDGASFDAEEAADEALDVVQVTPHIQLCAN